MASDKLRGLPSVDPISLEPLHITELSNKSGTISIRGAFELPRYARLDDDMAYFLEIFLRCRGILSSVEKELGISYPTVRTRLDQLLAALDLSPIREAGRNSANGKASEERERLITRLEAGEISAEEAKTKLRELGN